MSGPEAEYLAALREGRFVTQRCRSCQRWQFYPRVVCTHCGGQDLEWVAPAGGGTVYSTTVVRRKPAEGGDYNVALVDLDEGPRLMTCVVGIDPFEVRIGMKVRARVEAAQAEGAVPRVVFDPVGGA